VNPVPGSQILDWTQVLLRDWQINSVEEKKLLHFLKVKSLSKLFSLRNDAQINKEITEQAAANKLSLILKIQK
jgi:hypothetical protein